MPASWERRGEADCSQSSNEPMDERGVIAASSSSSVVAWGVAMTGGKGGGQEERGKEAIWLELN